MPAVFKQIRPSLMVSEIKKVKGSQKHFQQICFHCK